MSTSRASFAPLLVLLGACGTLGSEDGASNAELPVFTLAEPTLEIGVIEGNEAYSFAAIESVVRLPDGSVAVSDAGATKVSVFSPSGDFVRSWGTRGEGPGEFRNLSRIYPLGRDSLMVVDNSAARVSVFGLDGTYARQFAGVDLSGDSTFRFDSWLYGRFWVDGALEREARAGVQALIDRLPPPRVSPGYRVARVARDGGLWVREPAAGAAGPSRWTRLSKDGGPLAIVEMPARFRPLDILDDEVLGRWIGESDVHFVRSYRLTETGATRPPPAWLGAELSPVAEIPAVDDAELMDLMRQAIMSMARAQEIHYSSAYSYTTRVDSLRFEPPEGIEVSFTHADPRGWAAVFTHPSVDRLCGLAYGSGAPAGWVPGAINCGPSSAAR